MKSIVNTVRNRIYSKGRGFVFTKSRFLDAGSSSAVAKALERLADSGVIRRLGRGLYDYPRKHTSLGDLPANYEQIARALAGRDNLRIQPSGAYAANLLGLTVQVPARIVFLTDGPNRIMKIKNQQIVLKRTTPKNMAADQTTRTEEVPIVIALREAFVNMLIHRDYFDNTQYRIKIFKDKIEMFNPGSAPTEVKDLLADGATVPRNPIIAKVFRLIGWAETAGSGMMKIFNAWKQLDYDDPIIKNNIAGYTFKMTFPLIVSSKKKGKAELATQSATQSTDPVNRLLYILQDAELSSGELRLALKIKHRPTFRANYLHPAIEAGYIEYTIPDKPNSRLQKYRITAKGKSFLKKSEAVNPT